MAPTDQSLDTSQLERARADLRLVIGDKLVVFDAREDVVGHPLVGNDLGLEHGVEELVSIATERLGPVKRDIRVDEQLACIDPHAAACRNADAHAEPARVALIVHRLAHETDDPLRKGGKVGMTCHAGDNDDELVASDARYQIFGSDRCAKNVCSMDKKCVTSRVTKRVIDLFEAI